MNDALVSADPSDVDAVVKKVRLWLAKKRFYAAGWAVVATNRIMQKVEGYRSFLKYVTCPRFFFLFRAYFVFDQGSTWAEHCRGVRDCTYVLRYCVLVQDVTSLE